MKNDPVLIRDYNPAWPDCFAKLAADAYLKLWETAKKTGWTEKLEREEGTLLGYEDWQNEIHLISYRSRQAAQ